MVVYPDLASARIQTTNASGWCQSSSSSSSSPSSSSLPPQPPPSSAVLRRAEEALMSSSSSPSSSIVEMKYGFDVERGVLARAKAREGTTAREKSIELDLTGAQVDSFDRT